MKTRHPLIGRSATEDSDGGTVTSPTIRVLVCDDDEMLMSMVRFRLTRDFQADIVRAKDGREARLLLQSDRFDLIITDLYMPFHSGLELITLVREVLKLSTPIIILTADRHEKTLAQAFEMGANDFLTKPFNPADLTIRIRHLLPH